ncbi:MAG: SOS response-associated peptidase [Saccharofermentanales bacterium]
MCGRYLVITEDEIIEMRAILGELNQRFSDPDDLLLDSARGKADEMAPSLLAPVLVEDDETWRLQPMKWGFSHWDGKGSVINARSESVGEKSFFRDSFMHRRCIIPSSGFYEWKKGQPVPDEPTLFDMRLDCEFSPGKYWIRRKDTSLFLMAGIFRKSQDQETDEFVILTMPANSQIAPLHDRMPLFLEKSQILPWILDPGSIQALMANQRSSVGFDISMAGRAS